MNALKLLFVFAFCFSSTWLSAGSMTDVGHESDGDKDAALILVHDPGASGTFYYVAVAENRNGRYRGTL